MAGASAPDSNPTMGITFTISQMAVSGLKVSRLDLYGEKYKPFKGVKYITKAGRFQVRMWKRLQIWPSWILCLIWSFLNLCLQPRPFRCIWALISRKLYELQMFNEFEQSLKDHRPLNLLLVLNCVKTNYFLLPGSSHSSACRKTASRITENSTYIEH